MVSGEKRRDMRAPECLNDHRTVQILFNATHQRPTFFRLKCDIKGDDTVRIANINGRASLVLEGGFLDIAEASEGRFSSSVVETLTHIDQVAAWAAPYLETPLSSSQLEELATDERLGPVVERPRQIFAIGLNYRLHAAEMGLANPETPMVFTKFASALAGQHASVPVVSSFTDWEAELVVVIGREASHLSVDEALTAVGGYCVGQDISDRELQMKGSPAQFSLGKSWPNFAPVGPWLTTADEVPNPNGLTITCDVSGQRFQDSSTDDMVFSVAEIVSYLSGVVTLYPGDLIFTGSPVGVGQGQHPQRFLAVGDSITTSIEGLGTLHCTMVSPS